MLAANNSDPSLCPVRRLERYIQARNRAGVVTECLFPKNDGGAMAKSTPCGIVQRMVEEANTVALREEGIEEKWGAPELYGSHSLRRGGVTEARASGVEMLEIQRHGRWKSMAVWGYVGPTDAQRLQVTSGIFGAAANKKSISAPNTPVKPTKQQRKPRASPTKPPIAKRKREEDDDEPATEEAKEAERVEEHDWMEALQPGVEVGKAEATATKVVKSERPAKKLKLADEANGEKPAAKIATTPKRSAAKKASEKMIGQR